MTISAKVIADSTNGPNGPRLTTLQLRYPKFIHGEFMTHRVFSRNASSSRAIPVERLIKDVVDDPVYPSFWGKNQPGMQAKEEHNATIYPDGMKDIRHSNQEAWTGARYAAIYWARAFDQAGYHKQIVNRLLEPFCHINVVVTATEWDNFFALRCHSDAQPEMRLLAEAIRDAMENSAQSVLMPGQWHLPYVSYDDFFRTEYDHPNNTDIAIKLSVARCARVSYLTQDGKTPTIEDDLKLYERLVGSVPLHASPAEHQASPDIMTPRPGFLDGDQWKNPEVHGNFTGWVQYRKMLEAKIPLDDLELYTL